MEPQTASRLASEAVRDAPSLAGARPQIVASLTSLVPEPAAAAAVKRDDDDVLLALAGKMLYEVRVDPSAGGRVRVSSRRLEPDKATAAVEEIVEQTGHQLVRRRTWTFTFLSGERPLDIESEQLMRGGFDDERLPSAAEHLARQLARALCWNVPEKDEGQRMY